MDDNNIEAQETPEVDPFEVYADEGYRLHSEQSQFGDEWSNTLSKNDEPLVDVSLNRRNDVTTTVHTPLLGREALERIRHYLETNDMPAYHTEVDSDGRTIIRTADSGISFLVDSENVEGKVSRVQIGILQKKMIAPRSENPETYFQKQLLPFSDIVGVLQPEVPPLLMNILYNNAITKIMTQRLF